MARIAGVDLPRDKRVEIGLTYIYGIGRTSATRILAQAGVNPDIRCRDLTDDDVKKISAVIDETQTVEGDLRREIALNIKRLQEIVPGGVGPISVPSANASTLASIKSDTISYNTYSSIRHPVYTRVTCTRGSWSYFSSVKIGRAHV